MVVVAVQAQGTVMYNKKPLSEFVVEHTAAYVDQVGVAACALFHFQVGILCYCQLLYCTVPHEAGLYRSQLILGLDAGWKLYARLQHRCRCPHADTPSLAHVDKSQHSVCVHGGRLHSAPTGSCKLPQCRL